MLTEKQREYLMHGPPSHEQARAGRYRTFEGPCQVLVAWRRHRQELLDACPPGKPPYGYWMVEKRLKQRPAGEAGELRLIKQLDLYRDHAEREFVQKRLAIITAELRSHWHRRVA